MLGREDSPIKNISFICLSIILVFCISGCQNDSSLKIIKISSDTYSNLRLINNKKNHLNLIGNNLKHFSDLSKLPIKDVFSEATRFEYPKNINFIPTYLSGDNKLYGEGDESLDRTKLFLGSYDLNKEKFTNLIRLKSKSKYASIGILTANKDLIVYEESDQENNISKYYIYDLHMRDTIELYTISNIPALHYTQAHIAKEGIMFNFYDPDTTGYINMFYSFSLNNLIEIEKENCGFPILYNGLWYYVKIDNKKVKTQIIEFDLIGKSKKIIYETDDQREYISGLYSNGKDVFLTLQKNQITCLYKIDFKNNNINYLFESEWLESLVLNENYISWLGTNTLPERNRPQYFLYDIKTKMLYQNDGGAIFLSHNGIVWIEYKKKDNEIKKGEIYQDSNTSIVFKKNIKENR